MIGEALPYLINCDNCGGTFRDIAEEHISEENKREMEEDGWITFENSDKCFCYECVGEGLTNS